MEENSAVLISEVGMQAILVGCNNYPDPIDHLNGSHHDVHMMRTTLIRRFNFDPKKILVMIDTPGSKHTPTAENIKKELKKMIEKARVGDRLLFFFSGHGLCSERNQRVPPTIVACDDNNVTCMDFRYLVNRLPKNATFTIVADSCCSGGLIDQEPIQVGLPFHVPKPPRSVDEDNKPKMITYESYLARLSSRTGLNDPEIGPHLVQLFGSEASILYRLPAQQHPKPLKADQGILLSACEPNETAGDGPNGSAFTKTLVAILNEHTAPITNKKLVTKARGTLGNKKKDPQHPCLYCSRKNVEAVFLGKANARLEVGESSEQDNEAADDNV